MIVKIVPVFSTVFFLVFVINCETFADTELSLSNDDLCEYQTEPSSASEVVHSNEEITNEQKLEAKKKPTTEKFNITDTGSMTKNSSSVNATVNVSCVLNKTYSGLPVEIVNASKLASLLHVEPNVTNRQTPGKCVVVLFYSPSCPFSCMAAPHFNALARFFPDVKMVAVDAMKYRSFNAQFGIIGTPTLMLFHSGKPAAKFNETSEYGLEVFASFISKHTGIAPVGKLVVTSADFSGPVSSTPIKETDYYLLLSWMLIAARILYSLYYSTWGRSFVDATLNAWREAEAHHHVD